MKPASWRCRPPPPAAQAALLALAAIVVYLPALRAGFVWDDRLLVTGNELVHAADGWLRMWLGAENPDYYPITYTSFWLEWRLWGGNPAGFHALNIALHALNAVLLWRVLLRLRLPGAWFIALLFAVHPIHAASVGWISEQKNTLSLAFALGAALFFFRHEASRRRWEYGAALGCFVLALLSKTSVVMLPPALLLCAWWQRGRVTWLDVRRAAPFFALSLAAGLVTIWFQSHNVIRGEGIVLGDPLTRIVRAGWAASFYIGRILFPWRLSMLYPNWQVDPRSATWLLPALLLAAVLIVAGIFHRTWGRPILFGLGFFLISLLPVLGFVPMYYFRLSPVADHWLYLPAIGILALSVGAAVMLLRRLHCERAGVWLAALLAVVLGAITWQRAAVLENSRTVWSDVLRKDPGSGAAASNLALVEMADNRPAKALEYARLAARLDPGDVESWLNLGGILDANGLNVGAVEAYRRAVGMKPDFAQGRSELALALDHGGQLDEAAREYREAVRLQPRDGPLRLKLGLLLFRLERWTDAVEQFAVAVRLLPDVADAHNDLGAALHSLGRLDEAAAQYRDALRLNPAHPDARRNLDAIQRR
ncbi:MAG: tetratricopeptide repeat protein [Terrimicrobiaceae bacterium]|nr:tetratricopeptide repeat protein [Terrimicrobiaceae bacterium]